MCQHGDAADPYAELAGAVQRFVTRTHAPDRTDREAYDDLIRERRLIDLLHLDFAREAFRVEARERAEDSEHTSLIPWLTHSCRMAPGDASNALCVGEQMDTLERSVEAMREGGIGFAHLAHLAHTKEHLEFNGAHLDEARLLKRARVTSPNEFRRDCTHARHAADANRFREEEAAGTLESFLELRGPSHDRGMWLRGYLDPIAGATVRAALEPLARPRGADDLRPRGLRLAEAAHEMARFTLNTGGEDAEGNLATHCKVSHLMVTTTLETLTGQPGAPAGEIDGRIPVSTATVQRFACSANVSRVLLGPDSAVIDVGRARRLPSPPQRRALAVRDGGCVWPRCTMRSRFTEPHHVLHWTAHGGETDLANLVTLCFKHHDDVHLHGWQVVRVDGQREVLVIPPEPLRDVPIRGPGMPGAA